jgi:LysM repeat protein
LNRRVEFYILGAENFKPSGKVYILQPKNTLFSIAKENGMTVEELKNFNGLEGNDIKAYSPIRIPRRSHAVVIDKSENESPILAEDEEFYTVQAGNTLYSISKQFGMTVDELKTLNDFEHSSLSVGKKIKVKKK